jgi:hypothetical protein
MMLGMCPDIRCVPHFDLRHVGVLSAVLLTNMVSTPYRRLPFVRLTVFYMGVSQILVGSITDDCYSCEFNQSALSVPMLISEYVCFFRHHCLFTNMDEYRHKFHALW